MKKPGRERYKLVQMIYRRYFNMMVGNTKGFKIPNDVDYEFKLGAPIDYYKFKHKITQFDFDGDRESIAFAIKHNNLKSFREYIKYVYGGRKAIRLLDRESICVIKPGTSYDEFMEMMHG